MFLTTLMPSLNMLVDNSYASVKTLETEQLIADSLKNLTPVKNPSFCQVSGIPGAGKSTFCTKHLPKNCLFLSFDKLMLSLSIYQQTLKEQGAVAAFNKSEMTARIIGYELLSRAIDGHYNILFEHSGANPAHLELLKNLPQKGYKTAVNFIICNTDTAVKRSKERQKSINRYVPEEIIFNRSKELHKYIPAYQKIVANIAFFDGMNNFKPVK